MEGLTPEETVAVADAIVAFLSVCGAFKLARLIFR